MMALQNINISVVSLYSESDDLSPYVDNSYSTILLQDSISSISSIPNSQGLSHYSTFQPFLDILLTCFNYTLYTTTQLYRSMLLLTLAQVSNL
jgi:hypothetical protein